jgi:aconitate hydratase
MTFDIDMIKKVYERYPERIAAGKTSSTKPLTLS